MAIFGCHSIQVLSCFEKLRNTEQKIDAKCLSAKAQMQQVVVQTVSVGMNVPVRMFQLRAFLFHILLPLQTLRFFTAAVIFAVF